MSRVAFPNFSPEDAAGVDVDPGEEVPTALVTNNRASPYGMWSVNGPAALLSWSDDLICNKSEHWTAVAACPYPLPLVFAAAVWHH